MKTLIASILIALYIAFPIMAASPAQILNAPAAVLEQYGGQELEFTGVVISCTQAFDHLWAIWINAGELDVIGYVRHEVPVGQEVTLRGTCVGFRHDPRAAVVMNPAVVW